MGQLNQQFRFWVFAALFLLSACSEQPCKLPDPNQVKELKQQPRYLHPYTDLASEFKEKGIPSLRLFVYGSLMNPQSQARTLVHSDLTKQQLALAFGVQRLFNLDVAYKSGAKWGPLKTPASRGMLNIRVTENSEEFINGVIIELDISDLANLSERETFYDLIPVITADWKSFLYGKLTFSTAYILAAPEKPGITSSMILPRDEYLVYTRAAAAKYGSCFEDFWLNTTYLADGVTPVSAWLAKQPAATP